MAEYKSICRSCFHSYVCEQFNEHRECDNKKCHFANDHFVPAADVVEVVRCKDCAVPHNKWLGCPNLNGLIPPPDFYCAKGNRKGAKMDGKDGAE